VLQLEHFSSALPVAAAAALPVVDAWDPDVVVPESVQTEEPLVLERVGQIEADLLPA